MIKTLTNKTKEQLETMMNNFDKLNKYYLQEVTITNEFTGHCFDIGQKSSTCRCYRCGYSTLQSNRHTA